MCHAFNENSDKELEAGSFKNKDSESVLQVHIFPTWKTSAFCHKDASG